MQAAEVVDLDDLLDEQNRLPLAHQDDFMKRCVGVRVRLRGPIWSIKETKPGVARVQISTARHDTDVWFEVSFATVPALIGATSGTRLSVRGILSEDPLGFGLSDAHVTSVERLRCNREHR
jgi:hypothetical protein